MNNSDTDLLKLGSLTSGENEDIEKYYESLELISYELSEDITTIVKSALDVNEDPAQVLASYCLKSAFEYAEEEVREILLYAMKCKDIDSIIDRLNKSLYHNETMKDDELKAIIDMIN